MFNATYAFASGAPYTDLSVLRNGDSRGDVKPSNRQSFYDDFHRVNLSAKYQWKKNRLKPWAEASVFNLSNHANISSIRYLYLDPDNNCNNCPPGEAVGIGIRGLGRTFNLRIGIDF